MTKSLFRALLVLAGATLFAISALPAAAATLTYNDPNCAGFQITGSGGSFTLTCAKLQCSIAGNTNPATSVGTALVATCIPAGASYLWNLVAGPFSDATCQAPSQPTAASTGINKPAGIVAGQTRSCLYQVTASAPPLSGQAMVTVTWSDTPPAPPVCTPSGVTTPTPITNAGGTIALNANCIPSSGVTYTWTRTAPTVGAPTNPTTATPSDTLAANLGASAVNYSWQVVACTSPTTCDTKTISVSVPGTGGGGADCSLQGFGRTVLIDIPWNTASPTQYITQNYGGFTQATAVVIRLAAAPLGTVLLGSTGHIQMAEFGDPLTSRTFVLSTKACDWTNTIGSPYFLQSDSSTGDWSLKVNAVASYGYHTVTMQAGIDYYINVKLYNSAGSPTCGGSTCNMVVNWSKPN